MRRRDRDRRRNVPADESPDSPSKSSGLRAPPLRWLIAVGVVSFLASVVFADWWTTIPADVSPRFVGRDTCITCHQREGDLWKGSHHDLAMDLATPETVLADFDDATLEYHGIQARMFRKDGKYFVHTEGPDGKLADFQVKYVFGVAPLQQYMVEFNRRPDQPENEVAQIQVLRESWDVAKKRWFYLPPPDVQEKLAPDDELHWTGAAQRWNTMCADCHSTNLRRNFDVATKTYHTTFSEIDVSCEACHGPGSTHVELAKSWSLFWDRKAGYGLPRMKGADSRVQIETCAPCHSRRRIVTDDVRPGDAFHQGYAHELLNDLTYHADGQIRDEVYEYGSFLQSKMFHKGIRCSDCHDPHSAKLKHQGNQLCTSCHTHSPGKFDGPAHTFHQPGSTGASCVECHMPESTYMEVDPRRDHSLRIPRPSLSVSLGTPNACTRCHLQVDKVAEKLPAEKRAGLDDYGKWLERRSTDAAVRAELERVDRWAADKARAWWGDKMDDSKHYAHVLHAARQNARQTEEQLVKLAARRDAPAIVQATALQHLGGLDTKRSLESARQALGSPEPQVRAAAIGRYETQMMGIESAIADPRQLESAYRPLVRDLQPLLDDPARLVRTEAARQLARVPDPVLRAILLGTEYDRLERGIQEYVAGLKTNEDRAGTHMALALLHEGRGDRRAAEEAYRTAIELEPRTTGPRTNLAGLMERWAEQLEAGRQQAAAQGAPNDDPEVAQAIARARREAKKLRADELPLLERDARLSPRAVAVQYRYAMALYLSGDEERAEATLRSTLEVDPHSESVLYALTLLYEKQQKWDEAERAARTLVELQPTNGGYAELLQQVRRRGAPAP